MVGDTPTGLKRWLAGFVERRRRRLETPGHLRSAYLNAYLPDEDDAPEDASAGGNAVDQHASGESFEDRSAPEQSAPETHEGPP